jgi:RHS repeat-associated protein
VTPPAPLGPTSYEYDALGRVTSVTDGNDMITWYGYDDRDRPIFRTYGVGENWLDSTYYPNGLERTRIDYVSEQTMTLTYDHQGRLTNQSGPTTSTTQTYTYDHVGNILTYADTSGTTTYAYDAANQLTKLQEPGGSCPPTGSPAAGSGCVLFEYDQNALETRRILPGGADTVTLRDNAGRPTRITATTGSGAPAVDIGYSYAANGGTTPADDRGTVQSRTSYAEEGIAAGAITSYTYDSRNRLTLAQEAAGATITASWAYAYDANGNRTAQTRVGSTGAVAGTIAYGYNAANQLTSVTGQPSTWAYDSAGNQIRNGLTAVNSTYDIRQATTTIGATSATYFSIGNTDRLTLGNTAFTNGALGTMQRVGSTTTHNYVRTPGGDSVGMRDGASHYYIHDHLGSVVGIFTSAGTYQGGYSYSPYGETRVTGADSTVVTNSLRYIGQHLDGDGVYKLGARYYDTRLGRFTQMDPSGQESHPYAYVDGDPINKIDPSGRDGIFALGAIVDFLGFVDLARAIYDGDSRQIAIEIVSIGVGYLSGAICAGLVGGSSLAAGPIGSALGAIGCIAISTFVSEAAVGFN